MGFFSENRERRRDGEALIEWELDKANITLDDVRRSIREPNQSRVRGKKRKHPIKGLQKASKTRNARTLTRALKDSLDEPAENVPVVLEFCEKVGLEPSEHTVLDVVVQCQLYFALSGSAPHFMHLFDRIEGKIPNQTELKLDGRAGISEAMASMMAADAAEQIGMEEEYPEADSTHMEMLTGCKNAEAVVVEEDTEEDDEEDATE